MPQAEPRRKFDDILDAVIREMALQKHPVRVSSRDRTAEEQAKLFAKGRRGQPGEQIVTEKSGKPGDESRHQIGTAADIVFENPSDKSWDLLGQVAKKNGLKWGGDWQSLKDYGHIQLDDEMPQKSAVLDLPGPLGEDLKPFQATTPPVSDLPGPLGEDLKPIPPPKPATPPAKPVPVAKPGVVSSKEPGTFWGGFFNSMKPGGEADQASLQGLIGYGKGAILDLPSTLWGALKDLPEGVARLATDPAGTLKGAAEGASYMPGQLAQIAAMAGSQPEEFGRTMGNITGQPLAMELGLPPALNMAGKPIAAAGRVMGEHQPLTGMLPPFMAPRTARMVEGGVGRGIEAVGEAMKGAGKPKLKEIPGRGTEIPAPRGNRFKPEIKVKPEAKSSYAPSSGPMIETGPRTQVVPGEGQILEQLDPMTQPGIQPRQPSDYFPSYGPTVDTGPSVQMVPGEGQVVGQLDAGPSIGMQPPVPENYTPSYPQWTDDATRAAYQKANPQPTVNPTISEPVATGPAQQGLFDNPQPTIPNAENMSLTELAEKLTPKKTAATGDPFPDVKVGGTIRVKSATPERIGALKKVGFEPLETLKSGETRFRRIREFLTSEEGSFNLDALKNFFKQPEERQLPPRMVPDSGGQPLTIEGMPPLDVAGMASPRTTPNRSVFQMTPEELQDVLSGIYDEHGRYIAPRQSNIPPRPAGPWDQNFRP